jgi:hypothetical protein
MILNEHKQGKYKCCGILFATTVFLCSCLTGISQTNSFFQFVQSQSEPHYSNVPHEVLAAYYGWYGQIENNVDTAWGKVDTNKCENERTARYPVKGAYNSHDPAVIDWQIDQAKSHGVTGFVVSWWGTAPHESWQDQSLSLLIERAEKKNFKVSIYWEQSPGEGCGQIGRAINELSYALNKYGKSKSFLKVDGKPVVFAYGRVISQVPVTSWPAIITGVRSRAGDFVLIADGYLGSYACLFDGLHTYAPDDCPPDVLFNLRPDNLDKFRAWALNEYANGAKLARARSRIICDLVSPGFDARKAYKINYQTDRLDGQAYRTMWEEAIKSNPDWIMITSWNEWPEGTEIEPSLELRDKYLQITAEYADRFLNSAVVNVPRSADALKMALGTTHEKSEALADRKVAILTQGRLHDAEFWAAYCGANPQRVDWPDLIDSTKFNAKQFPILIYIGGERFVSSVKTTDDVTRALVRYLHEGGFLITIPVGGVWPFYYDQSRGNKPAAITDKLGLGITGMGNWDAIPSGVEFKLSPNKNTLSGLPDTAAYPTNGDVRFRPAIRSQVSASDFYLPLVQLWDDQKRFRGDAAVYIEHRTTALSPGKTIYISQRTPEALGSDKFYPSLYQFISTKLKPLPASNP